LKHLKRLKLANNQVKYCDLPIPKRLEELNLEGNQLQSLPDEIGQCQNLRSLILSENHLTQLPDGIVNLKNLELLLLTGNELTELPADIAKLSQLKTLVAKENHFSESEKERIRAALPNCKVYL